MNFRNEDFLQNEDHSSQTLNDNTSQTSFDQNQNQDSHNLNVEEESLYTYVIIRDDLKMPVGNAVSQGIHASRLSMLHFLKRFPERADEFIELNSCGSVAVVKGKNLQALQRAYEEAQLANLPCAIFSDSGHILPPHFLGDPVTSALSIGPAPREAMRRITKKFQCL